MVACRLWCRAAVCLSVWVCRGHVGQGSAGDVREMCVLLCRRRVVIWRRCCSGCWQHVVEATHVLGCNWCAGHCRRPSIPATPPWTCAGCCGPGSGGSRCHLSSSLSVRRTTVRSARQGRSICCQAMQAFVATWAVLCRLILVLCCGGGRPCCCCC